MKRRALLATTGTVAACLAGCLDEPGSDADGPEWVHDVGGWVGAVAEDRVFLTEEWRGDSDGEGSITADDGDHLWSYGSTQGYSAFTDLTVADAVYVGYGDDAVGSGAGELYAVEFDGTERWTVDTGSVYERPRVGDETVYVGSDDGIVRSIDADTGEVLWRHEVETTETGGPPDPTVEAVDGTAVYVATGHLLALDPGTGDRLWRFGDEDASVSSVTVHRGVAYVRDGYDVRAVVDGEELWTTATDVELFPRVTVDDGRVFVRAGTTLRRLDADDGGERWSVDVEGVRDWTVHDDSLYVAGPALHAFDADGGEGRWTDSVADGPLNRVLEADAVTGGESHVVFVERKDESIHRMSPDGEQTWNVSVPRDVQSFEVDDMVYVGTNEEVFAYDTE